MNTPLSNREVEEKIINIMDALERIRNRISIVTLIVGLSGILYLVISSYVDMDKFYNSTLQKIAAPSGLVTTVIVVFLIGIALYIFKLKQQFWYGVFESVFALLSCYFSAKALKPDAVSNLIVFGSSIYLIVRGLTNILDGVKKPFWTKNEVTGIGTTVSSVSRQSLINALRDKRTLVNILAKAAKFVFRIT